MRQHFYRSLTWAILAGLCWLLFWVTPAPAVTIAVGSETFLVETFPLPVIAEVNPHPLDLTLDRLGTTVYVLPEFDRRMYSVAQNAVAGTTMTAISIPAPDTPIFRNITGGADTPSFISFQNERILSTPDGSIWVSQGGAYFYTGQGNNRSRIMRRKPDTTWEAFTLPVDNAGAAGFFVDNALQFLYVATCIDNAIYSTRLRGWFLGETNATRYPPVDTRWRLVRGFGSTGLCPAQLNGITDRRLVGTLYFGTAFFLYQLPTEAFTSVALTAPPAGTPFGSSGPWQILQHPDGIHLYIAEDYAQRVTRYHLFTGAQTIYDLSGSLSADEHPHSLTFDGTDVYVTTYSTSVGGDGRLVKISAAGTVTVGTSFATISLSGGLTGIVRDSDGKLWTTLYRQKAVARLTRQ